MNGCRYPGYNLGERSADCAIASTSLRGNRVAVGGGCGVRLALGSLCGICGLLTTFAITSVANISNGAVTGDLDGCILGGFHIMAFALKGEGNALIASGRRGDVSCGRSLGLTTSSGSGYSILVVISTIDEGCFADSIS